MSLKIRICDMKGCSCEETKWSPFHKVGNKFYCLNCWANMFLFGKYGSINLVSLVFKHKLKSWNYLLLEIGL